MSVEQVRPEFPRPDWQRVGKQWENLNGKWEFAFDDQDKGILEGWWKWTAKSKEQPFDREWEGGEKGETETERSENLILPTYCHAGTILVPFTHQTELSGVFDRRPHEVGEWKWGHRVCCQQRANRLQSVWYARTFKFPKNLKEDDRVLLHFGAVDYHATVWVDGNQVSFGHAVSRI